jgi:hypothetical protein
MIKKENKYNSLLLKLIIPVILLLSCFTATSQDINYKAQSLYIYKFTKFISWPEANTNRNFIIGVYGNSPIFEELLIMATLKKTGTGQKIIIKKIESIDQIGEEQIIYIASSKSRELKNILDKAQNHPILLVAEREGLAKKGACINFIILDNDNLKFEINTRIIEKHQLSVSQELLSYGYEVN